MDLNYIGRRTLLKRIMIVTAIIGVGLMTWLPSQLGRFQQAKIERFAFDYIKAIAEKDLPQAAFSNTDEYRSEWDRFVVEQLTNAEILKVNAFNQAGKLIYSTGRITPEDGWHIATAGRNITTRVGLAKRLTSIYGNEEPVHAMRIYIPIHSGRQIMGGLEVVQDIEFIFSRVRGLQAGIGAITLALLFGLSLAMYAASRQETFALEEKNRKLSSYDSNVSHRLRDPLTTIKGAASILRDEATSGEIVQTELLKMIEDEADLLNRDINDILNLTSLENSRLYLRKTPVRIDSLLKESAARAAKQAGISKVKIETKLPKEIFKIKADQEKMVQAVGNLLIASVMRSMAGATVSLGARYEKGGTCFEISDTGEELSPDEITTYFDRFNWVERSGAQQQRTGLELPIAKAIVEAHDGKISVASDLGQGGAKFSFKLPVVEAAGERRRGGQ